jgi:hypothetical protein
MLSKERKKEKKPKMTRNMETVPQPATLLLLTATHFATRAEPQEDGVPETLALAAMQRIASVVTLRNFQIAKSSVSKLGRLRMRIIALTMVLVFATGFLGAIPLQANKEIALPQSADQERVHSFADGNWSTFIVTLHSSIQNISFEIAELNGTITLTDEQKEAISTCFNSSGTICVTPGSLRSYHPETEISHWEITPICFLGIPIGVDLHIHLAPIDAINSMEAINVLEKTCLIIIPIIIAALLATAVVGTIVAAVDFAIWVVCEDYGHIYDTDKNSDKSFDITPAITLDFVLFHGWLFCRTPHYLWAATPIGAYIVSSQNPLDLPVVCWAGGSSPGRRIR